MVALQVLTVNRLFLYCGVLHKVEQNNHLVKFSSTLKDLRDTHKYGMDTCVTNEDSLRLYMLIPIVLTQ